MTAKILMKISLTLLISNIHSISEEQLLNATPKY